MQRQVGHYIISYYVPSALLVGSLNRHLIHHPMWRNIRWTIQVFKWASKYIYIYVEWYVGVYEICIHPGVYEHGELLVGAKRSAWSGDFGHLHLAHSHHSHSEVNFQINKHEHIIISWLTHFILNGTLFKQTYTVFKQTNKSISTFQINENTSWSPFIGVFDTLSDSIQCLNFAKKWFIQYLIQYSFTQDSIQNITQFK